MGSGLPLGAAHSSAVALNSHNKEIQVTATKNVKVPACWGISARYALPRHSAVTEVRQTHPREAGGPHQQDRHGRRRKE